MVSGFLPVLATGMAGSLLAELIRVAAALRQGRPPHGRDYAASLLYVLIGAGAVLYGWDARPAFETATVGATFPLLFTTAINAATTKNNQPAGTRGLAPGRPIPPQGRSFVDYLASRF